MVVKMMKWRPWPPPPSPTKYDVTVVVHHIEGWYSLREGTDDVDEEPMRLTVEIRWKGPPNKLQVPLMRRRKVKRDSTADHNSPPFRDRDGAVFVWNHEFRNVCSFCPNNNNVYEIDFLLLQGAKPGTKSKSPAFATASLNLAEYTSMTEQKEFDLNIPLIFSGNVPDVCPSLHIHLSLLELRTIQESGDSVQRSIVDVASSPSQPGETPPSEKDDFSALKAGFRKVKILTEYVSSRRSKKACPEEESSEDDYTFDSESFEESGEGETNEGKEDAGVRKSFSYGSLAYANYVGDSFFTSKWVNSKDEDWVYYSYRKSDVGCSNVEDSSASICEPPLLQTSKRSILPWRKRKLSFRSPKSKGEPLLKKAYGEEGGDDIDFDRRQLSSDESISFGCHKAEEDLAAVSDFGDDSFAVGRWEQKEIVSRDGLMKLYAEVFFASIDQRSERAAGESACTALVAIIANWFHNNHNLMPIKSQFDSLIREGSLEWRNLCENETYREKFPDKHFDLDTVLQSKICPLSVYPGKSFVGFFHPEQTDEGKFDFLQGAMSFDGIWNEISNGEPVVYIISWNDHFFVLKVETDAYYIIDTLGERLFEGCNHAYILKFDQKTKIVKLPVNSQPSDEKPASDKTNPGKETEKRTELVDQNYEQKGESTEEEVICQGKEACKAYIKNFLAAIPIREVIADLKKGLVGPSPLHRLQIEFHYTQIRPVLPLSAETRPTSGEAGGMTSLADGQVVVTESVDNV